MICKNKTKAFLLNISLVIVFFQSWAMGPEYRRTVTIDAFPYTQNFSSTVFPPSGWLNVPLDGGWVWERKTTGVFPSAQPLTGGAIITFESYNASQGRSAALITPLCHIPGPGYQLRFTMYRDSGDPFSDDRVEIWYNSQAQMQGATYMGIINRPISLPPQEPSTGWYDYVYEIPYPAGNNGQLHFLFTAISDYGNNLHIDAIYIEQVPTNPFLELNPGMISFGMVLTGESSLVHTLLMSNSGSGTITINEGDITITGADASSFSMEYINYPLHLTMGGTQTIPVLFSPSTSGEKSATLSINHNGQNSPSQAELSGKGYEPLPSFFENFESAQVPQLPEGWKKIAPSEPVGPQVITTSNPMFTPVSGTVQARMDNALFSSVELLLISPKVTGVNTNSLSFHAYGFNGILQVGTISDPNDHTTFELAESFELSGSHTPYQVSFPYSAENETYLAFRHGLQGNNINIFIDNVSWELNDGMPVFSVTPQEAHMGSVSIGNIAEQEFIISNQGEGIMRINPSGLSLQGEHASEFLLHNLQQPVNLGAGHTASLLVEFAPLTPGPKTASLFIYDNISPDSFHEILLTGTALPAVFNVDFWVKCNNGLFLENIDIEISGQPTITTNSQGIAIIELPDGVYNFNITALGFHAMENELFSVDGEDLSLEVVLQRTVGIPETNSPGRVRIFPNPAHNLINITSEIIILQASILNLTGQVMASFAPGGATFQIDVSGFKPGIYLIRIQTEQGSVSRKIEISSRR